jgi:hypothetical protein
MIDILISAAALCAPMLIVTALCGAVALCETIGERFGKRRFQRWEDDRRA